MFCPECGKGLEEGKSFCKYCGASVAAALATHQSAPPAPPSAPPAPPAPPPPFQPPPPAQAPPPFQQAPPSAPPPFATAQQPKYQPQPQYQPPMQPQPPRPSSGGEPRPRWVMPFLLTMGGLIVVSLIGLVVIIVTSGGGSSNRDDPVVSVTTTLMNDGTTTISTPDASDGSPTTATVPGYDPGSTGTTADGQQTVVADYVAALDRLEAALAYADGQIPGLADQINNTAPGVPAGVTRDLQQLHDDVATALDELALIDPPVQYRSADDLIFQASDEMLYRIEQTIEGIDAMWTEGTVAAGNPHFDEGREARDAFRSLFKDYQASRP